MKKRKSLYLDDFGGSPDIQENRIARRLKGKRVSGSGRSGYSKGDVRDVSIERIDDNRIEFLIECKQTKNASISLKWSWLRKIMKESLEVGKEPALSIEIKGGDDDYLCDRDWIMIPLRIFERMIK